MKTVYMFLIFVLLAIGHAAAQPLAVTITSPVNPIGYNVSSAGANDGSATAIGSGGTGNLLYLWNTGAVTSTVTGLPAGSYCVTVTDGVGATVTDCIVLTEPPVGMCWTAPQIIIEENIQFISVGNSELFTPAIGQDTVLQMVYTCLNPSEQYGVLIDPGVTDHISLGFVPQARADLERIQVGFNGTGNTYSINLGPNMFYFTPDSLSPCIHDTAYVYQNGVFVGKFGHSDQMYFMRGDTLLGVAVSAFDLGTKLRFGLAFSSPTDFMYNPAGLFMTGDEISFTCDYLGQGGAQLDHLQYTVSGDALVFKIESALDTMITDTQVVDTPIVLPPPVVLPTNGPNDPFMYVSMAMMTALTDWTLVSDTIRPSIHDYLPQVAGLSNSEVQEVLLQFTCPQSPVGCPCLCKPFTVDPGLALSEVPYGINEGQDGDNQYVKWWHRISGYGPAYADYLAIWGNNKRGEQGRPTSTHSATFDALYICVDELGFTAKCCEQSVNVRVQYDSRQIVEVDASGGWSKGARGSAEDVAYLYAYDWQPNTDVSVLAAKQSGAAHHVSSNWNPTFWIGVVALAAEITTVVISGGITVSNVLAMQQTLQVLIGNPAMNTSGANGRTEETMQLFYNGSLPLMANRRKTIRLESQGHLYGRGYGGDWETHTRVGGDYVMVVEIPRHPDPQCCVNQSARWTLDAFSESPASQASLRDVVGGFLYPSRPWYDAMTNQAIPANLALGKLNISANYGLAWDTDFCSGAVSAGSPPTPALPNLHLYPNPALGTLHVEGLPPGATRYTVCDMQGRALLETQSPDIDVRDLAAGMYLLRVHAKGVASTLRFVKE